LQILALEEKGERDVEVDSRRKDNSNKCNHVYYKGHKWKITMGKGTLEEQNFKNDFRD